MRKKALSIVLAALMCLMTATPVLADNESKTPPERGLIEVTFDLDHVSGSTYNMNAEITNYLSEQVTVGLGIFDSDYNLIASVGTVSTNPIIYLSKNVSLSPGTYYLRIAVVGLTVSKAITRPYTI